MARIPLNPIDLIRIAGISVASVSFALLFVIPLAHLLSFDFELKTFVDPLVLSSLRLTLEIASLSTLISTVFGFPLGLWVASSPEKTYAVSLRLLGAPFVIPSLVASMTWVHLLNEKGFFHTLEISFSSTAVIVAQVFFNIPWIAHQIARARREVPQVEMDAASTLGANEMRRASKILWPRLKWPLLSAASQVFIFCTTSFALVLILGGGPPTETLETFIYSSIRLGGLDLSSAVAASLWQILINFVPWVFVSLANRKQQRLTVDISHRRCVSYGAPSLVTLIVCGSFVGLYFIPLFPIEIVSLDRDEVLKSLLVSSEIAASTTLFSLILALSWIISFFAIRSQLWRTICTMLSSLPNSISLFSFGLGFYLAYAKFLNPFDGQKIAVIALQSFIFYPIAFRWLWPLTLNFQRIEFEAALSLGASPLKALYEIEWPRWRQPLWFVAALIVGASLGEFGLVSLFRNESLIPLPLYLSRLMSQYRFEEARLMTGFLLILSLAPFLLLRSSKIPMPGNS